MINPEGICRFLDNIEDGVDRVQFIEHMKLVRDRRGYTISVRLADRVIVKAGIDLDAVLKQVADEMVNAMLEQGKSEN